MLNTCKFLLTILVLILLVGIPFQDSSGRESLVVVTGLPEEERAADLVLETLIRLGEGGEPYPWLAESWSVSDDGLTWTIYLRHGVFFHDFSPLTAADVAYSLGPYDVEVLGDFELAIHLDEPNPFLPIVLSVLPILPSNFGEFENGEVQITQLIGTGPYQPIEWVPGMHVVLRRFDYYWGELPPFDHVIFKWVPEPNVQVLMLNAGDADLILDAEGGQLVEAARYPMLRVYTFPTDNPYALLFNLRTDIFSDIRVRKALAFALGLETIHNILDPLFRGCGAPCAGPIAAGYLTYCPVPIKRDLELAAKLMQEAGWRRRNGVWEKDGKALAFTIIATPDICANIAELIRAFLAEFGAIVEVWVMERGQFYYTLYQHDFETAIVQLGSALASPLLGIWRSDALSNITGFSDPEVDELIDSFNYELDPRHRREILDEIDRRVAEAFPAFWLVYPCRGVIAREIEGLYLEVNPWETIIRGSGALRVRNKRSYLWCVWKTLNCEVLTAGCLAAVPVAVVACKAVCVGTVGLKCVECVIAGGAGVVSLCETAYDCWVTMVENCR